MSKGHLSGRMGTERPSILLITSDQQHWDTLGVTNPRIKTPALDRLAADSARLGREYSPPRSCRRRAAPAIATRR